MNRPALMGIVNVTPDSFSGDGKLAGDAVLHAERLLNEGADILDLGGESTRPGATVLSAEEEWARLEPVLSGIIDQPWRMRVRLSVDTRHAETAERALGMGIDIINDVGGLREVAMLETLEAHNCDIVVMHALSIPADPSQVLPPDCDVVAEILRWKKEAITRAGDHGIAPERLIFDPGIGFGKSAVQSRALVEGAAQLRASGGRWLVGHSRKSFLGLKEAGNDAKDAATLEISLKLAEAGVDYLRVHNIALHAKRFA